MFGRETARELVESSRRDLSRSFSDMTSRRNYRADVVVVGRVHRSRSGYIGHDGSLVEHPGAMLSIHAVESIREPKPTEDEIARAPSLPFCAIAEGDPRMDGQLVRVKGTYLVVGWHFPYLGNPTDDKCEGPVSLSFDEEVNRFTRNYDQTMDAVESFRDMTVVARVDLHRPWFQGHFLVHLVVFAIESVEPRN
jgi:hypothetical protein